MELSQKQALFMMNYAQYATYKIRTYNNIAVLEDEYKNLKDNMNLEIIKDESSVQTINYLMDAIYEERKNNKNRERLKSSLEKKMNNAIYESFQQMPNVFIGTGFRGANLLSKSNIGVLINSAMNLGSMYMNYKKYKNKLSEEYDEKMWEYQQLTEDELNYIYRLLNTYSHQLIQQYGISDEWRLNENELSKMFDFLKDEDSNRKFANLKNLSSDRFYIHFPLYWYHLAQSAMEIGNEKEALEAYKRFEEENIPIFRYDTTAVDAYKGKISILLKNQENNLEEIKTKLNFIEINKTSWNDYYFVALVYANIDDTENAKRILERNINELAAAVDSDLMDKDSLIKIYTSNYELDGGNKISKDDMYYSYYQSDAAKKSAKAPYNTLYDGLELCRSLLQKIGYEKIALDSIEKQYKLNTVSFNEVLYWFGKTPAKEVVKKSIEEIKKIKLSVHGSDKTVFIECQIPLQWMLSSNTKIFAEFLDSEGNTLQYLLDIEESEMKKLKKETITECELIYSTGKLQIDWKKKNIKFSKLVLSHPFYPIELKYNIDLNSHYKKIIPDIIYFNDSEYVIEKEEIVSVTKAFSSVGKSVAKDLKQGFGQIADTIKKKIKK